MKLVDRVLGGNAADRRDRRVLRRRGLGAQRQLRDLPRRLAIGLEVEMGNCDRGEEGQGGDGGDPGEQPPERVPLDASVGRRAAEQGEVGEPPGRQRAREGEAEPRDPADADGEREPAGRRADEAGAMVPAERGDEDRDR